MLDVLRADIDTALGLTARSSVSDLDTSALYSPTPLSQPSTRE
jgi:hypothetical protein